MSQGLCDRQQQDMSERYLIDDSAPNYKLDDERWHEYQNASSPMIINPTDDQLEKLFTGDFKESN
jgi:hypothetical protein